MAKGNTRGPLSADAYEFAQKDKSRHAHTAEIVHG